MKKRIIIVLVIALLFMTGCSAEYNLNLEGNSYKEKIIITASNSEESSDLNNDIKIPIEREIYDCPGDTDGNNYANGVVYDYQRNGNSAIFSHDFSHYDFIDSTAIYECYNTVNVFEEGGNLIISTSNQAHCFDNHPPLTNLTIKLTLDRKVIKHNADSVNGNTYIWNINRNNAQNKPVNIIIGEKLNNDSSNSTVPSGNVASSNDTSNIANLIPRINIKKDYSLYIFLGVLVVLCFVGYLVYLKIKKNENNLDV